MQNHIPNKTMTIRSSTSSESLAFNNQDCIPVLIMIIFLFVCLFACLFVCLKKLLMRTSGIFVD